MKQRILTALLLLFITIPPLVCGGYLFLAYMTTVMLLAMYELIHANANIKKNALIFIVVGLFMTSSLFDQSNDLLITSSSILLYLTILMCVTIIEKSLKIADSAYIFMMSCLVAAGLSGIYGLYEMDPQLLILLGLTTYGCDSGAYFSGYFFGKHKLIPHLSPKKTIEGSIGGSIVGTSVAFLYLTYFTNLEVTVPFIAVCFILTITSQFGDLIFSAVKRQFEIKDFSNLLPGHGGVLDRLDSLLFNAIVLSLFIIMG